QLVSAALVIESIEQDTDGIVVENGVSFGDRCANLARLVITEKCKVDETRVVAGSNFRLNRRRLRVAGPPLVEISEDRRLFRYFIIQLSVDHWRLIEMRQPHGRNFFGRRGHGSASRRWRRRGTGSGGL